MGWRRLTAWCRAFDPRAAPSMRELAAASNEHERRRADRHEDHRELDQGAEDERPPGLTTTDEPQRNEATDGQPGPDDDTHEQRGTHPLDRLA